MLIYATFAFFISLFAHKPFKPFENSFGEKLQNCTKRRFSRITCICLFSQYDKEKLSSTTKYKIKANPLCVRDFLMSDWQFKKKDLCGIFS